MNIEDIPRIRKEFQDIREKHAETMTTSYDGVAGAKKALHGLIELDKMRDILSVTYFGKAVSDPSATLDLIEHFLEAK